MERKGNYFMKRCMSCMELVDDNCLICPHCGYQKETNENSGLHMQEGEILCDRYIIGKPLGSGGFGVTYIAWDTVLQCKVAIKEYMPSEFATRALNEAKVTVFAGNQQEQFESGLEKFFDEAIRLAQFNSVEGIVHVYDCIKANDTAYIIMELLEGETLLSYLEREKNISTEKAVEMLLPVAEALKLVHQEGLIHRDIAPDNLFLTKDGKIKLIDFGAARFATTQHSRSLSVLIKEGYSAEEQYRSQGKQGAYTDIYALGAVLYHMITGEVPIDALKRKEALSNQQKDPLLPVEKFTKNVPENVANAIYNAMNVQIEDRTQNAEQLIYELTTDEPVARKKGHIKSNVILRFPLWAKITLPICIVGLVIVAVLLNQNEDFDFDFITIKEGYTRVPSVISMELDNADTRLKEAVLSYQIVGKEYSDEIGADLVLTQDINGGEVVEMNSMLALTISGGVEMKTVSDVVGMNRQKAVEMLEKKGFAVTINEEYHSTIAKDSVISQSVLGGTDYPVNSEIILTISKGQDPNKVSENIIVTVPDFTGKTYEEALTLAEQSHLTISAEEKQYSSDFAKDLIISQKTQAGTEIKSGSLIELVVSLGKEMVKVPDVQYKTEEEARTLLEENRFSVQVTYESDAVVQAGLVIRQTPEKDTELEPNSVVSIVVSTGTEPPPPTEVPPTPTEVISNNDNGNENNDNSNSDNNGMVTVPNVVGMSENEAAQTLINSGLAYYTDIQWGEFEGVVSQDTEAGSVVPWGSTITIHVTTHTSLIRVEDVVGMTREEAVSTLQGIGFNVSVVEANSDTIPAGQVMSQDWAAGSIFNQGDTTTITITVSKGA